MDTESRPAAGRQRRNWLWWFLFTVVAVVGVFYVSRPGIDVGPPPPPVSVGDAGELGERATLEDAVEIAREGLARMDAELVDYVGRIVKRERIQGTLGETVEMAFKIRTRRQALTGEDGTTIAPYQPMAVYLKFLQPASSAGREVIWVEGQNEGKLIAHEAGFANLFRASLDPEGFFAMRGNLHPLPEIGFKNLVRQLIERSEAIAAAGGADVTFVENFKVGDRPCLLIQVRPTTAATDNPAVDFWLAEIAIDLERGIPLRYAAYGRPETEGAQPPLLEEYVYLDVRLNVGLTDEDFNPDNPAYQFP